MRKKIIILLFAAFIFFLFAESAVFAKGEATRVFSVEGDAKVIPLGSNVGVQCREGMVVNPGDWIRTGPNSFVTFAFDGDAENVVKVQENSLVIMRLDGYFKVQLLKGKVNAILENVQHGETFRVLTPSVVTESASSGWMVTADGNYSTVVVVEGEAYVLGIDKDGSIKKDRYKVDEGYGRTVRMHEDPGELTAAPESVLQWFRDQVVEHHLARVISEKAESQPEASSAQRDTSEKGSDSAAGAGRAAQGPAARLSGGRNIVIVDGEEVDILEYIYKRRLSGLD